jgi:2-(1,2-epoxy-1,2-dihydrophenyl)acetyl-CoA isomerase
LILFKEILLSKEGPVATITLNNPERYNALGATITSELLSALVMCRKDRETRVVVLTGSGKAFCSGGDISYFEKFAGSDPSEPVRQLLDPLHRIVLEIRQMPKPVLAVINRDIIRNTMHQRCFCPYAFHNISDFSEHIASPLS